MIRESDSEHGGAAAVTTHHLTKRYGTDTALDAVDLLVPEGAVYVLIGGNGAGKSTTLKVLMNLERPSSGTAEVFGLDTALRGPEVRAQVGYVPERHNPGYGWMTGGRLLQHIASYYPSWDDAYADHLIRGLDLRASRRVGSLSKGETRRLQLVMALAHRPPLLLLDEPTDGLDPVVRKRTLALLAEHLADTPTTVLITTHHLYEVESLEVPDGWEAPSDLRIASERRSRTGREVQCIVVGEERAITERLTLAAARVHEVSSLALEDAALAFLPEEATR
jgi:ABC-2 type transport system ATP-binding protein